MDALLNDLRFAGRQLLRAPTFTIAAVLTLALGIGANTALFTLGNALLLRPRPGVQGAEQLVWISPMHPTRGRPMGMSHPALQEYRQLTDVFAGVAGLDDGWFSVSGEGAHEPARVRGQFVSGNYFDVIGARMALGRGFTADEDTSTSAPPVTVLAHHFWLDRFAGDSAVLGRPLIINGHAVTVVGIASPGFNGADHDERLRALWLPMIQIAVVTPGGATVLTSQNGQFVDAIARLRDGVSEERATAAVATVAARRWQADTSDGRPKTARIYSASAGVPAGGERGIIPLAALSAGVTGVILLIACANVSNLLLARAVRRRRELAVRLALGAGRWRIVRQLLTESLALGALGSVLALLVSVWGTEALVATVVPIPLEVTPDASVLAFSVGIAIAASVMFGLVPALQATRADISATLKDGSAGATGRRSRLQATLVSAQIALSFLLLVTAGLFLRGLQRAGAVDVGFDTSTSVLALSFDLNMQGYDSVRQREFLRELVDRARALPGVETAVTTGQLPMSDVRIYARVHAQSKSELPSDSERDAIWALQSPVAPGYFGAIRLPLVRGRDFTALDIPGSAPVAIVSKELATRLWGREEALGKRIHVQGARADWLTVVGVARDASPGGVGQHTEPGVYFPSAQRPELMNVSLLVRSRDGDASRLAPSLRAELRRMDPNLPVYNVQTLAQYRRDSTAETRNGSMLLGVFGAVALLLASVGVYGVLAFAVGQRTREVGVRMALGARPEQIVRLFFREGVRRVVPGLIVGIALGVGVATVLSRQFYGVEPLDAVAFVAVAALLSAVASIATWLPARRAARVNPTVALTSE